MSWAAGKTKAKIRVAIRRVIPIAVSGTAFPGGIVPATSADHAVSTLGDIPKSFQNILLKMNTIPMLYDGKK